MPEQSPNTPSPNAAHHADDPNAAVARRARRWPVVLVVVLIAASLATTVALSAGPADAASLQSGGFTTKAVTSPTSVARGQTISVTTTVTASTTRRALVDVEIYSATGAKVLQRVWDAQSFTAGVARTFTTTWTVPTNEPLNTHTVRIGMFSTGWGQLHHWNANGASFSVTASSTTTTRPPTTTAPPATTTSRPATTTTRPPTTTTPVTSTTTPTGTRFVTLAPGAALPSEADCAARVRKTAEVRPQNATANSTKGFGSPTNPPYDRYKRVTGNFTGTTDEIIQWAACK